ncbi:helix-turn-helix domain-containing protein, partial [Okeania sp. SIO1I7]
MEFIQHRDKNTESAKLFGCVRTVWNDSLAC